MARQRAAKDESAPEMTEQERAELDGRLARMFSPPHKREVGAGRFFLLWMARTDSGSVQPMLWNPETPEEIRGANFFYDAAHGLGAFAREVKAGTPVRRTTDDTALVRAIIQNRADDTGYLVYADYLTEQGHSQGDFIRLCVELARMAPDDPEYHEKFARRQELVDAHAEEWYAALGELGLRPDLYGTYIPWLWLSLEYGVIEEVAIDQKGILPQNADRLFAAAPFLRKLEFQKGHLDAAGLAKVKQLGQIEELDLSYANLPVADLRALLRSKYLTGLRTLNLGGTEIGDAGTAALTKWPGLAQLEALDVSNCGLTSHGLSRFVVTESFARLKRVHLGRNAHDQISLIALLNPPHKSQLTELELGGAHFEARTPRFFRTAPFAKTLRSLDLDSATFEREAFEQLALECEFPALRVLKLNNVDLRLPAASHLANAAFRETLEELYIDNCHLAAGNFFYQSKFPKLKVLDVSRNRIERYGLEMLVSKVRSFPALTNLRLWDNRLGAEAIATLAKSSILANVTHLDLSGNKIGPAGALALAKSKHLKKLTALVVDEKAVGKRGKQALLDRFGENVMSFR